LLGLVGVVVIALGLPMDARHAFDIVGLLGALGCALFYALSNVLMRQQSSRDSLLTLVMLTNLFAALYSTPFVALHWQTPSAIHLLTFVLAGFLGTCGHVCMAWAYARAPAGRLGVMEYSAFLWASAFGFILFAEVPHATTIAGAALILIACLRGVWQPRRRFRTRVDTGRSCPRSKPTDSETGGI
jgi:drug/metabolite transporter (DMT)-like permease